MSDILQRMYSNCPLSISNKLGSFDGEFHVDYSYKKRYPDDKFRFDSNFGHW